MSTWAVSHALRGGKSVNAETRARIVKIAGDLGYRPNQAARALVSARTNMVAIWLPDRTGEFSPYYARLQHYMLLAARKYGYYCFVEDYIFDERGNPDFTQLINLAVDGVILCDVPGVQSIRQSVDPNGRLPMVSVGSYAIEAGIDHITVDLYPGSVDAVKHLIAAGCRRVALVGSLPLEARFDAYAGVVRAAGLREECIIIPDYNNRKSITAGLLNYVHSRGMPDGLFCENDDAAIACYRAFCEMGVRVPEDVCIVGCDGIEETEYLPTQISTIVTPLKELADTAWKLLTKRIEDPTIPLQEHLITPRLEVRASSSRPAKAALTTPPGPERS